MKSKSSVKSKLDEIVLKPRQKYSHKPNSKTFYDVVIIGTGVVGYAAAMYAGRLGLKTLIIGELQGGTITLTNVVENYPGIVSLSGQKLAELSMNHAMDYDIDMLNSRVEKIEDHTKEGKKHFVIKTRKEIFKGKTVIYCTGSKWRKLGVSGEKEYENKGVSYCALCDGPLFRNKIVAVVGGSDSAVKEALLLSDFAKKVYIIYRKEKLRAEPVNMHRLESLIKKGKVSVIYNTNVVRIEGEDQLKRVIFDKSFNGKREFNLDGLFIEIGHEPLSELAREIKVKTSDNGEIMINRKSETNISGFYAAGDVTDTDFKQAITGVGEAVHAAYSAYEYVNKGEYVLPCDEC